MDDRRYHLAAQHDLTVGSYHLVREIGSGGMGSVYLAEHPILGRKVAIKILRPEFSRDEDLVNRFFNEARATARLKHPAFLEVFDCGLTDSRAFIVMEYVDGENLGARLARIGRMDIRQAVDITAQIAEAVATAHEHAIVHRDLKPDNVILAKNVSPDRVAVKVLDFGIAKLSGPEESGPQTQTGILLGTPHYMSPEQCRGSGTVDHRADIYSLGCILHALLLGQPPFPRVGAGEVVAAHLYEPVKPLRELDPSLPDDVAAIVQKALAKHPEERQQTMRELARELDSCAMPSHIVRPPVNVGQTLLLPSTREAGIKPAVAKATLEPAAPNGEFLFDEAVLNARRSSPRREHRSRPILVGAAVAGLLAIAVVLWQEDFFLGVPPERSPEPRVHEQTPFRQDPEPSQSPLPETASGPPPTPSTSAASTAQPARLRLTTIPPDATIAVNGERVGNPFEWQFRTGQIVRVRATARGYLPKDVVIDMAKDREEAISLLRISRPQSRAPRESSRHGLSAGASQRDQLPGDATSTAPAAGGATTAPETQLVPNSERDRRRLYDPGALPLKRNPAQ